MDMKPVICPYCGREMELDDRCFPGYGFWYTCECGTSGPICKSEEEAYQYANPSTQPKWIRVKDNPPDGTKDVIAYNMYGEMLIGHVLAMSNGKEYYCETPQDNIYHVTHWMPRPESPKEE